MRQPEKNINRGRLKGSTSAMSAALLYSTSPNSVFVMKQGVLSRDVACPVIGHRKKLKTKCGQPFFYLLTSAPRSLFPIPLLPLPYTPHPPYRAPTPAPAPSSPLSPRLQPWLQPPPPQSPQSSMPVPSAPHR